MGAVDSQGDLLNQQDFLFQAELAQRQVKRLAVDVLHRNVRLALKLPDLEHLADVVVIESRCARASCISRSAASALGTRKNLSATSLPSLRSRARNTVPIPPCPSGRTIS